MNHILEEDLIQIIDSDILDWEKFNGKRIFITGATGLIGSILVKSILMKNKRDGFNINLLLLVRNIDSAIKLFGNSEFIKYVEMSVEECENINDIDYIIHAASQTKSKFLNNNPVETIDISVIGTKKILEIARNNNILSMVYLSSMEVYGLLNNENVVENNLGYIDLKSTRSSYPESKRMCELYCYSYYKEYNVPVKNVRLAQTFGAGISCQENRVYKVFADAILDKQNIVLKSTGKTKINFCYTTDAIIGILFLLLNGKDGESYNVVSESSNMTILDSAKWLVEEFGNGQLEVIIDIDDQSSNYAPDNSMVLSNKKIKELGWVCKYTLKEGYRRLINYLEEERKNEEKNNIN